MTTDPKILSHDQLVKLVRMYDITFNKLLTCNDHFLDQLTLIDPVKIQVMIAETNNDLVWRSTVENWVNAGLSAIDGMNASFRKITNSSETKH